MTNQYQDAIAEVISEFRANNAQVERIAKALREAGIDPDPLTTGIALLVLSAEIWLEHDVDGFNGLAFSRMAYVAHGYAEAMRARREELKRDGK